MQHGPVAKNQHLYRNVFHVRTSNYDTRGLIGYGLPRREKGTVGGKWKVEAPKFNIIYCGKNLCSVSVTSEVVPYNKLEGAVVG
jgi:hypothetical protein